MLNNIGDDIMEWILELLKGLGITAALSAVIPIFVTRYLSKKDKKNQDIEELKKSKEEYEKIQREIRETLDRIEEKFELYDDAMQSLLRERIIQTYNHYMDRKTMPIYARESLSRMCKEYNALNKFETDTITPLIEKLYELPTE